MSTPTPSSSDDRKSEGPDRLLGDTRLFAGLVGLALLLFLLTVILLGLGVLEVLK